MTQQELEEQIRLAKERSAELEAEQAKLLDKNRAITLGFAAAHHGLRPEAIPAAVALIDWALIQDDLDLDLALDELYASDSYLFLERAPREPVPDIDAGARSRGPLDHLDPDEISESTARERLRRGHDPWYQDR